MMGIPIYGDLSVVPNHSFGYAEQNPLLKIDPTGEAGLAVPIGIGVAICSKFPQLCINGARAVGAAIGSAIAMCFEGEEEDKCEKQAQEDEQICRMATLPSTSARSRCWESVQKRYGACRAGSPLPPLVVG